MLTLVHLGLECNGNVNREDATGVLQLRVTTGIGYMCYIVCLLGAFFRALFHWVTPTPQKWKPNYQAKMRCEGGCCNINVDKLDIPDEVRAILGVDENNGNVSCKAIWQLTEQHGTWANMNKFNRILKDLSKMNRKRENKVLVKVETGRSGIFMPGRRVTGAVIHQPDIESGSTVHVDNPVHSSRRKRPLHKSGVPHDEGEVQLPTLQRDSQKVEEGDEEDDENGRSPWQRGSQTSNDGDERTSWQRDGQLSLDGGQRGSRSSVDSAVGDRPSWQRRSSNGSTSSAIDISDVYADNTLGGGGGDRRRRGAY
jgi:hypothetical protein